MRKSDLIILFDYNYWANEKIVTAARQASPAQLTEPVTAGGQTVLRILIHILAAEWAWRVRVQEGDSPPTQLDPNSFTDLDALLVRWAEEEQAMRAYLTALPEGDQDQSIHYRSRQGEPYATPLWQILVHVVNHGTQHRAEAAHCLTEMDYSPGDIDFSRRFQRA